MSRRAADADQAAVVAFACESAVMLLFGQQMVQAGGLAQDVALHARWRTRESRVLRQALRLSDIRNRPLVQGLCDKWCLAE